MNWWHKIKRMAPWYQAEIAASAARTERLNKITELDKIDIHALDAMVKRSLKLLEPRDEPPIP